MSGGDSMKLAAHRRSERDDQGGTVRASSASRNRKLESRANLMFDQLSRSLRATGWPAVWSGLRRRNVAYEP